MRSRFSLINLGLYPETLPPCFVSQDSKRAFHGLIGRLDNEKFFERRTDYVRYNGTKHDGNRRNFGTPNIIFYFHISSFIWRNWGKIEKNYRISSYSISQPRLSEWSNERAIKVPSLSELSTKTSENIRYAPFILKADIAQCFHSIYTHSIAWAAHGIEQSKADTDKNSTHNKFNALDFFVRNSQRGNTRGVLVGPDAYRLIAEFILSKIDQELQSSVGHMIVGAVRHVDDYYIGLRTEYDANSVLSSLREILWTYELNINDHKTKIVSSLEPINDLWAQRLRQHTDGVVFFPNIQKIERAISEAIEVATQVGSDSPVKILLRAFDEKKMYNSIHWDFIDKNIQRIVQKHPHAIDYACLLVAKRKACGHGIDEDGWQAVAEIIIRRGLAFEHHHEVVWMLWLLIVCKIDISPDLIEAVAKSRNSHVRSLVVAAFMDGRMRRKPKISLGSGLATGDADWLVNLIAKSCGYSKAKFSGLYAEEFTHLAEKNIKLIDFEQHMERVAIETRNAISRTRYGYDDDETDKNGDDDDDDSNGYDYNYIHDVDDDGGIALNNTDDDEIPW